MDQLLYVGYFFGVVLFIVLLICFFALCGNVAQIKKQITGTRDYTEYLISVRMGDREKALYHLKRSYFYDEISGMDTRQLNMLYEDKFKKLGVDMSSL